MIRATKIDYLVSKGFNIKYHYYTYEKYRYMIVDQIEDLHYNTTTSDQRLAKTLIDLMYDEQISL